MKKLLAGGTLAVLALGGMVATAAPASAHTWGVESSCGSLSVNLTQFSGADVTVVIDAITVDQQQFDRKFTQTYELSRDRAHSWSVIVDAHDSDQFDGQKSDTQKACEPPAQPTEAVLTPPAPVTECAATLDDVALPPNTEAISYRKSDAGIVAALTSDDYVFPEDLGNYVPQEDGSALLPTEYVVIEEKCADSTPEPTTSAGGSDDTSDDEDGSASAATPTPSPSPSAEAPPVLAATGATVGGAIAFAALLAAGGVVLVWARKRMQKA